MFKPDAKDLSAGKPDHGSVNEAPKNIGSEQQNNDAFNKARGVGLADALPALKAHFGRTPEITGVDASVGQVAKPVTDVTSASPGNEKAGASKHAVTAHELSFSNIFHNVVDIGETMAVGVKDAAVDTAKGIAHGAENVGEGIEHGAEWAYRHPGETAAIVAVGAAVVGTALVTGGAGLLPALEVGASAIGTIATSSAAATTLEVAGATIAAYGTARAGVNVYEHGELSTLMNQQNMSPEQVNAARAQLKNDTGGALLNDSLLGAGLLVKGLIGARVASKAVVAEAGSKAAATAGGATELAERSADAAKLSTAPVEAAKSTGDAAKIAAANNAAANPAEVAKTTGASSPGSYNLDDGRLSIQEASHASAAHVEVRAGTMTHPDGTTSDVFFHAEEIKYGKISPEATAARLQKEQGSFHLNKTIGFENSYPESRAMTTVVKGQANKGWIQEAAGKPLESELKERAVAQFGTTSNMDKDVAKILDSDPALRKQVEDAVVERVVYGDKDIGAKNLGVSTEGGAPKVRNFDSGESYPTEAGTSSPTISSYQNSLTTIGLQNAMSGRALSAEMTKKLGDFAAQYADASGAERLSQSTGLSAEQTRGVIERARSLAESGKLPTIDAKINEPDNIAFYRMLDELPPRH